jgi:uncharacterized protein YbjT (DUF2867 family)
MFLVTGATGRLGGRVVRLLRQAAMEVRALVRPGSEYFWLNDTGCDYFFGDLREARSLSRACRGVRYVVHAAGIEVESTDNHHSVVTLQGTIDLIDASVKRGIEHFVMFSCVGADRGFANPSFDCLDKAEQHLKASGLRYTILRCPVFAEDLAESARQLAQGRPWRMWGSPGGRVAPLSRKDAAIFALASLDKGHDRTLELGGPESLTTEQAVARACAVAGADASQVQWFGGVKSRAAALAARAAGRRWKHWIERQALLYGEDLAVDGPAVAAEMGLPLTPLDQALTEQLHAERLGEDPEDRDERVVHRQFQATVYSPGEGAWADLPEGPLREVD